MRRFLLALLAVLAGSTGAMAQPQPWTDVLTKARGQSIFWNAWGGDDRNNAYIAWVGDEVQKRFGVTLRHVKIGDTAEAVKSVVTDKAAGRNSGGPVDLIWINGPNFLAMKEQGLLHGPFVEMLPNYRFVDIENKPSNVIDFTVPVGGLESPWRVAQFVFIHDSARTKDMPRSIPAMLEWAKRNPGRLTHPSVRNFLGATFLKQALYELTPDPAVLQKPASDANFAGVTAPLWAWYDQLLPLLWRQGKQFPETGPAQRQLLADGEIDILISFNPFEAASSIAGGVLPNTVRTFVMDRGTIGNTSFVAIPYNAAHKEAAMVVANFLLDPIAQAKAADPAVLGAVTVLDLKELSAEQRKLFDDVPRGAATPSAEELGKVLLEPHASWMTRITEEWGKRYTR